MSMASSGWRIHPIDEMEATTSAVSSSGYGGLSMPRVAVSPQQRSPSTSRERKPMSLEDAYWSGMRKRAGMSRSKVNEDSVTDEYEQLRIGMANYVTDNFHQKECMRFVPKPNQNVKTIRNLKCHCGEILSFHVWGRSSKESIYAFVPQELHGIVRRPTDAPPEVMPQVRWDEKDCIEIAPSISYGKINFNVEMIGGKKPAKYIRLSNDDSVDSCLELMQTFWRIMEPHPPNLVISVVGGAKNFRLDGEMRETFANGLIKAAKTTNAWLITSGFNMGVMKSVGQAVHEGQAFEWGNDRMTHLLRCIAIAPWGYVYNRRFLEGKDKKGKFNAFYRTSNTILHGQPVPLNPDHTHFIFVDDGFRNRYGGSASFRAKFERKLRTPKTENGYGIPVVMLVVEGGADALHDASHSLKEGIPVVVCTGTGRAADLLTYAYKFTVKDRDGKRVMNDRHRKNLEERVLQAYGKTWGSRTSEELEKCMGKIDECVENSELMIFFDLRREEDLDVAILSVLTKVETYTGGKDTSQINQQALGKHRLKQLELALTWNRADIAQSEIFREDINWEPRELYDIMTKALLEDKMDFVRLLLNQGLSMKEYLTVPRLESLYNSIPKHNFLPIILKRHCHKEEFTLQDIGSFLRNLLDRFDDDVISKSKDPASKFKKRGGRFSGRRRFMDTTDTEADEEAEQQFKRPYKQLMIWAVLLDRPQLAKFFWEMGEEPITSALATTLICKGMHRRVPKYLSSVREDFLAVKTMFEKLATEVANECHATDPDKAIMLVERKSPTWSRMTCLQIAATADDQVCICLQEISEFSPLFMSSVACQSSINVVWKNGILSDWRRVFLAVVLPILIFPLVQVMDIGNKRQGNCQKILTFYTAPITKFAYHTLFYLGFLGLYTYMLLVDFQKYPSPLEYVLMLWIITFLIGEIHTFLAFPSPTLVGKLRDWFTFINRLVVCNLVLALISFALRGNADYYTSAKTIYCINAVMFYIGIIRVYIANSHLGPKLYMIIRMVEELVLFILVLIVFLLAYGVASQGLLYQAREPSWNILRDIIYFPYWQLYGEIFLDEIATDEDCVSKLSNGTSLLAYDNTCRQAYWLVPILLGLYLLVGNVLLLNLLIAIFSHVFDTVEQNSIEIWKYQMYFLTMEFQVKSKLPPPLSIFWHAGILIRFIARRLCCKKSGPSQQYQQHHLTYLALFEKEMMANYLRRLKSQSMDSMERKFAKLQKRVDMLNKIIEDRHVEDEIQSSLQISDSFTSVTNALLRQVGLSRRPSGLPSSVSAPEINESLTAKPPLSAQSTLREEKGKEKEEQGAEREEARREMWKDRENAAGDAGKEGEKEKTSAVLFHLDSKEDEEAKKKRKKKKKKKDKHRSKERHRDESTEKKELNINVPEKDAKVIPDKLLSDENNATYSPDRGAAMPVRRPTTPTDPAVFFMRPPSTPDIQPPQQDAIDVGDEPDVESEEDRMPPASPRRRRSGGLNMLSQSEYWARAQEDYASSSDDGGQSFSRREFQRPRPRRTNSRGHGHRQQKKDSEGEYESV